MWRILFAAALLGLLLLTGCRNDIRDCPWFFEPDYAMTGDPVAAP